MEHCSMRARPYHDLALQPQIVLQGLRESTGGKGLPTASTKRRTRRGPARKVASDEGDTNVTAHRSRAAAPNNTPVPAEANGRCPKRQAGTPTSEPGPSSSDHNSLPPAASKRPKVAAQHNPAVAPADVIEIDQQQAPHGGMQLQGQLNAVALDAATVVMHMYRKTHGIRSVTLPPCILPPHSNLELTVQDLLSQSLSLQDYAAMFARVLLCCNPSTAGDCSAPAI